MKGLKKILSSSLALFIVLANIAPAFASDINQQILEETYIQIPEELKEETQEKARNPGDENQSIEENQVIPTEEEENPKEEENLDAKSEEILKPEKLAKEEKVTFKLKLKLIGFIGREFDFDEVFPNGAKLDFIYLDKRTKEEKTMTQSLRADQDEIDFGSLYLEEIQSGKLELNKETDGSDMALIDERLDFSKYNPNLDFVYKIYQIPNSKVEFRTFDKNGNLIANPNFGKFTYRIENLIRDNQDLANHSTRSLIKPSEIDFKLWEDKYENLSLPSISLEESQNGYIENGDFAYKICGQGHIDDDLTKPFEVRLIQKSKLIQATDRPTYTDPETAREIVDLDYENQGQYWTLRGLKVQVPEEKTDLEEIDQASDHSEEKTEEKEKNIDQIMDLRSQALEKQDPDSQAKLPDLENLLNKKEEEKQEGDKEKEEVKEDKEESQEADKNPADSAENPEEEKPEADLEISPQPEENRQMAGGDEVKPGFNETKFVVKVNLHPLYGKEKFDFNKIFPNGLMVSAEGSYDVYFEDSKNGQPVIEHLVKDDYYDEKEFSPDNPVVDFGIVSQLLFFSSFKRIDELKEFPKGESEILVDYDAPEYRLLETISAPTVPRYDDYPTTIIEVNMYQTHNTEIIVKTIDENKGSIPNPTGQLTHTIGNENRTVSIPSNSDPTDTFGRLVIYDGNGGNYSNFNGSQESRVSLDGADANGFLVEGDYAYKIIEQKQDDKAEPLEVTIQKKPLIRTENPNDTDYVKVDFLAGDHGSITENKTYWVLKGVDLGDRLSPPAVTPEKNYKFKNWNPDFPTSNQSFNQDTSFTAQYEEDGEPGYNGNNVIVKVNLHGLVGKEFDFDKIFPNGQGAEVRYVTLDSEFNEKSISKPFTATQRELDFGKFSQEEIEFGSIDFESSRVDGKAVVTTSSGTGGHTGTTTYNLDLYEIQNREVIFKTQDQNGNEIGANPVGKFTYILANTKKTGDIPTNFSTKEMIASNEVDSTNWKGNYDGTHAPSVELDNAQNGFIVDGEYAYKILKQEQKDNDKSNPLEVTLIRKQKVIVGGDHPKTTDPTTGSEIDDPDYVKVEFSAGDKGSISENEISTYWVLSGVSVGDLIKPPKVSPKANNEFESWQPEVKDKYSENTKHEAKYKEVAEEKDYNYLTYAGDIITDTISAYDEHYMRWFSLVDRGDERALGEGKSSIILDNSDGLAKIEMDPIYHYTEKVVQEVTSILKISVENDYGAKVLATDEKEIKHTKYVFSQDYYGNKAWKAVNITIKNQNTKGTVSPEDVSALQYQLTKDQIIDAVKKGTYTYNSDVPEQNKTGINALHTSVDGKQILNEDKVQSITVTDEDFAKIDQGNTSSVQQVKATITYLDGSKSDVMVNVTLSPNIPTGLRDTGYFMPILLLSFGLMASLISLVIFRKKILNYYE